MSKRSEGKIHRFFSWRWWNERVIEVPDHYYDWYAPRWYMIFVVAGYIAWLAAFVKALLVLAR